jgi:oligopeptide/dipeptide ABC transporter ATP-binding protein
MGRKDARKEALKLLRSVRITDPERVYRSYPHELSGGMCQRVCIAIALAGEPELIIADEPTTGLDVTIQAEILRLLGDVISEHNAAGMLITHDLGVVADVCDRVAVMYAGRVVNLGSTEEIYRDALHPYANQLVSIATSLDSGGTPQEIPGRVPNPGDELAACAFAPRCFRAESECFEQEPPVVNIEGQMAFCHHPITTEAALL